MEKNLRCCFAGHNKVYGEDIRESLAKTAELLITQYGVKEFWIGNYGQFDFCARSILQALKKEYAIEIDLVIPYLTKDICQNTDFYHKRFDNILMADIPEKTPKRIYIIKANEYMINNSEFLICNVEYPWGGAAKTLEYAKRRKLQIFNLSKNSRVI